MRRVFAALLLLTAPTAAAAVPAQLTTQGRVLDADGQPLEDSRDVTFRLVDSETGGSTLWEESQSVSFTSGFYTVMLGADEAGNPLDDEVLDQWPLFLEVQLDGEPAMVPRMAVGSVPYARIAGTAEGLAPGADIDAGSLTVDGTEVVASDGSWTGPTPAVDWTELTGIPGDFSDGDDADTLDDLVCSDRQWAVFDAAAAAWMCDGFSDSTLTDSDVVAAVGTDVVDLYPGSTMDGYTLLTEDSDIEWDLLVSVPADLEDGDDDTLAGLSCSDGEVAVYDSTAAAWVCGADTDTTLTASEVVDAVEAAAGLALPTGTTVGGDSVVTSTSTVAWSQLTSVPSGLADGDDDTLGALSCSGAAIPVFSGTAWTCGTDTDTTLTSAEVVAAIDAASAVAMTGTLSIAGYAVLTENSTIDWSLLSGVPSGLADGDDDTLAGLACSDGEVAAYDSAAGWSCATSASTGPSNRVVHMCRPSLSSTTSGLYSSGSIYYRTSENLWASVSNSAVPDDGDLLLSGSTEAISDCGGPYIVYADGDAYRGHSQTTGALLGSWATVGSSSGYLIDSTGTVYSSVTSSSMTTSSVFTGTGWDDVFFAGGRDNSSGSWAACGIQGGVITCFDTLASGYTLPAPPTSSSNFERVNAHPGCTLSSASSTSSSSSCTGFVCGITDVGTALCEDQHSSSDITVPTGTYDKVQFFFDSNSGSYREVTICGLDSAGNLECEENVFSSGWTSTATSLTGYGFTDFTVVDVGKVHVITSDSRVVGVSL